MMQNVVVAHDQIVLAIRISLALFSPPTMAHPIASVHHVQRANGTIAANDVALIDAQAIRRFHVLLVVVLMDQCSVLDVAV